MCDLPPCWKTHVVLDDRLEEVYNILVFDVLRSVTRDIKGAEAGSVLAEFVTPEIAIGRTLGDPVLVHVGEKVVLAQWFEEGANAGSIIRDDWSSRRRASGSVRRGRRIVLPGEVTVLGI